MGWGGARPGAGRPPGRRDGRKRVTRPTERMVKVAASVNKATEHLVTQRATVFEGDSVAFLTTIYKDEMLPLGVRMQAAALVSPFERPRLNALDARFLLEAQKGHVVDDARERLATPPHDMPAPRSETL